MTVRLYSEVGRWALKDNSMIFSNVIWCNRDDVSIYHLIDEDRNEIKFNLEECMEEFKL